MTMFGLASCAPRNEPYPCSVCGVAAMKRSGSKSWCTRTRSAPSRPMAWRSAGAAGRMETAGRLKLPLLVLFVAARLLAKPLETIRHLRPIASFVGELTNQQCERLGVAGDPQGTGIHGIETRVTDQLGSDLFAARIVPAVYETGPGGFAPGLENAEEHLARHGVESTDDSRFGNPLRELLRARGRAAEDEPGVVGVHRERAGHDHLSRQVAGLRQDVVHSRPMHSQQESVGFLRGLLRRARSRVLARLSCELSQLFVTARITEYHLVLRTREDRPELAAHQSRAQNSNSHAASSIAAMARSTVDHSLRAFRVPSPLHRDLGRGAFDIAEIALGELDGNRRDILLQTMQLRGAGDRHDPGLLCEEPGERDLGGRRVLALSDAPEQIDQPLVRLPGLRSEAGDGVAEVGAVEGGALVDLACEEALAQRAEGNEADSQLFEGRDDLRFGFSPPQRVLALKGRDGLYGVRAT